MTLVKPILAQHYPDELWRVTRPAAGLQKETYVAESTQHKVFLKFDTDTPAWQRLAEIGVAPPLLHQGRCEGRPYIIQQFVEGTHPDRAWLARNADLLARVVNRYHHDRPLREMLSVTHAGSYTQHVQREVTALESALSAASAPMFGGERLRRAFQQFGEQAGQLRPAPLVPVHPDPSSANMLVTDQGLILVDWDDLLLSDPMRDAGLLVWWYLPEKKWQRFFEAYGATVDRDKICWWVARRSLEVALWFDGRQAHKPARSFLEDFYRAVDGQSNPQSA